MTIEERKARFKNTKEYKDIFKTLPIEVKEVLAKYSSAIEIGYNIGVIAGREQARQANTISLF